MTEALSTAARRGRDAITSSRLRPLRNAALRSVSSAAATRPVEIIAPDHYCAALLLEEATKGVSG